MKVTAEDKKRAAAAYSEAVNTECPDGIQKDECWKCAQEVIAKHIAKARRDGFRAGSEAARKPAKRGAR